MNSEKKCLLYLADNCIFSGLMDNYLDVVCMHRNNGVIDITTVTSNFYNGNSDYFNRLLDTKGLKFIPFKDIDIKEFDYVIAYYGMSKYPSVLSEEEYIRKFIINSINNIPLDEKVYNCKQGYNIFLLSINAHNEMLYYGFDERKIIPCTLLCNPDFSIDNFEKLQRNPPSIIANNCYGRYSYFVLGTHFYSPFVNITLNSKEHIKLLKNPKKFITGRLVFAGMRDLSQRDIDDIVEKESNSTSEIKPNIVPTAYLESDDDRVLIYCNHYKTFDDFERVWIKRKERINYDNLIAVLITQNFDDAYEFSKLSCRKLCFLHDPKNPDLLDVREIDKGIVKFNYDIFKSFYKDYYTKRLGISIRENDYFTVANNFGMRSFPFFHLLEFLTEGRVVITDDINKDLLISTYLTKIIWG